MAVQPPFAAGGEQAVEREHAQDLFPVRAFAAASQAWGEEVVKVEIAPELVAQPAGAPGAGAGELQLGEAHLHGAGIVRGRRTILGEQGALAGLALGFIEDLDGLSARRRAASR